MHVIEFQAEEMHMMNRRVAGIVATLVALCGSGAQALDEVVSLKSPQGGLQLRIVPSTTRGVSFSISLNGRAVIDPSRMVFSVDGNELTRGAVVDKVTTDQVDERYAWNGKKSEVRNRSNGLRIAVKHPAGDYLILARAYDDGAAFRLVVPTEGKRRPDEGTTFTLPEGSVVWYHGLGGHYEDTYQKKQVGEIAEGEWAGPPVTFKLPGGAAYASITEAALRNYSGMALEADGKRGLRIGLGHRQPMNYPFKLRYGQEEHDRLSKPADVTGPLVTPWRVVIVGRDLNQLVNSDIVRNLCPPPDEKLFPQGARTEWIMPGRAVWKYLDGGQNTMEEMRSFSKCAGELGFEHHVIEGFWRRWTPEELKGLADYSRERGVGLWLWRHSKDLRTPEARREFFETCAKAGAVGVKLDFFDHEAKEVVDLYETLLREAAEHKLLVNFHGANKPTGLERTWPNELTREAVRGMESSRTKERAVHNTTLPFTRLLAGSADYTPVHFGPRKGDTTATHQIASAAVLDSALLTYGAYPTKLLEHPAVEMIKAIPATWDETIVLSGSEIGEAAVMARRKGDVWFVAILNGPEKRAFEVPLTFLEDGEHAALVVKDKGEDGEAVEVEKRTLRREDVLKLELRSGGGWIARLSVEK